MHFIRFFFSAGWLAFISIPHLFMSKFLYEFKWNFIAAIVAFASIMLMFTIPPMIIFAPLAYAFSSGAYALGTLHSMLLFMGIGSSHCEKAMLPEVLKVGMIQSAGVIVIWVVVYGVVTTGFDAEYLSLFWTDTAAFMSQEEARLYAGQWPVIGLVLVLLFTMHAVWGALVGVVMAAAGYGLGPKQESFNGFWGFGYRWLTILLTQLGWNIIATGGVLIVVIAMSPEIPWDTVQHVFNAFVFGQELNMDAHPWALPVWDSTGQKLLGVFLLVIWNRFPEAIRAASNCKAFYERLQIHQQAKLDAMPTAAEKQAIYEDHAKEMAKLRDQRMPSRWRDT
jgi:hypothetical protein